LVFMGYRDKRKLSLSFRALQWGSQMCFLESADVLSG
jgi:hypothetical protein